MRMIFLNSAKQYKRFELGQNYLKHTVLTRIRTTQIKK